MAKRDDSRRRYAERSKARGQEKRQIDVREAHVTVSVEWASKSFTIADISFDQKRREAAEGIGGAIIDFIYESTEGKRAAK